MKRARMSFIFVLLAFSPLLGCGSAAKRSGYLHDYDHLKPGKHLQNYWADSTQVHEGSYARIFVDSIAIDRITDHGDVRSKDCQAWLHEGLVLAVGSAGEHLVFDGDPTDIPARLQLSITDMTPGSASARFWAAEFGAGHAFVQVEGRVVDRETGVELVNFSDRRRGTGALGLNDIGGDAGPGMIRSMLRQIAADLVLELKGTFGFLKENGPPTPSGP